MSAKSSNVWANVGRNDPCPCGSGRTYKFCCRNRPISERNKRFIAELRPDIDDEVDQLMQKLETGAGAKVEGKIKVLLAAYPNYHMTNYAMGVYLAFVAKDPGAALPYFEKAVEIFPPFPEAHFNLGNAARRSADIPKAVTAYRNAQRYSDPGDGIAEMARKELQFLEQVIAENTRLKTLDAYLASAQLFDDAFVCLSKGQFERAIEMFTRVLDGDPRHVQSYGNMGLAYAALGKKAAALECLDKALALDPSYEPARFNRFGIANMKDGERFAASQILETRYYEERRLTMPP